MVRVGSRCFGVKYRAGDEVVAQVIQTLSSWDDAGWRSLTVQRFEHVPSTDLLRLPPSPDHHLWLITAGEGHMDTHDGGRWRTTTIAPGRLGATVPGTATRVRYDTTSPMHTVQVHLPARCVERAAAQLNIDQPDSPALEHDPLLATLLPTLVRAVESRVDDMYAQSAAEFLAVHLLTRSGEAIPDIVTREDVRIRKVVGFMRERLAEPLTLADLAGAANLSNYHFLRVFKSATGQTPRRYLTQLRIDEAKRLLRRAGSVAEVARACGFSSPGHLSTAFLRETGTRPSAYRG
jgi:AraC family transcriptional regulator